MELVFSLLPLLFQMMPVSEAISKLHKANVTMSERLDSLFKRPRYDPRLRPDFNEKPVTVTVGFWVLAIDSINVMDMEIGFDIFLRQTWEDNRLDHGLNDTLSLSNTVLSQIWLPDSYFKNAKHANFHDVTAPNIMITIGPGGLVYYNARVTLKTSCPMDLRLYPMDVQECPLIMESYGYNVNDIVYKWEKSNGDGMSFVPRDMKMLPQFKLTKLHLSTVFTKYVIANSRKVVGQKVHATIPKGNLGYVFIGDWSGVQAKFTLQRLYSFQVIHLYGPSGLIVALSWLTFLLPSSQSPARVTLGVTSVLTIVTILTMSNNSMPKVNYVKAIDRYLIVCFLFVFCSLLEYAVVLFLEKAKWRFENQMRERKQMLEKLNSHQTTHNETNGRTKQRTSSTIVTLEEHNLTEAMNTGYTYTNKPCHRVITSCQGKTQSPNASSTDLSRDTRQSSWHSIQQFIYREAFIVGVDEVSLKLFPFVFLSFNLYYWSTIFFFPQTI